MATRLSKSQAVYDCTIARLRRDGMPTDRPDYVMGDPPYRYDDTTIDNFLRSVKRCLNLQTPSYLFTYDAKFRTGALKQSVAALMASIETRTK